MNSAGIAGNGVSEERIKSYIGTMIDPDEVEDYWSAKSFLMRYMQDPSQWEQAKTISEEKKLAVEATEKILKNGLEKGFTVGVYYKYTVGVTDLMRAPPGDIKGIDSAAARRYWPHLEAQKRIYQDNQVDPHYDE